MHRLRQKQLHPTNMFMVNIRKTVITTEILRQLNAYGDNEYIVLSSNLMSFIYAWT